MFQILNILQQFWGGLLSFSRDVTRIYIGLTDITTEAAWEWLDSSTLTYTNWDDKEPNNEGKGGEDCVVVLEYGVWNDVSCSGKYNFVCKKPNGKKSSPKLSLILNKTLNCQNPFIKV